MSSHPTADAFMRGYLRNPTDVTARLVFADWLEETGKPWNRAWAYYIRTKAEAEQYAPGSSERRDLEQQAAGYAGRIRARLKIPAALFVGYPKSLLGLLPGPNITVRLAGYDIPRDVIEYVPESIARENLLIPLHVQGRVVLIAAGDPWRDDTAAKLQFILNRDVVMVRAGLDDVADAIERCYGQTEAETVDSLLIAPGDGLWYSPHEPMESELADALDSAAAAVTVRTMNVILTEGFNSLLAEVIRFIPGPEGTAVRYRIGGVWGDRDSIPTRLLPALAARVAIMAGIDVRSLFVEGLPGTGQFPLRVRNTPYSLRASIQPTDSGPAIDLELIHEPEPAA